MRIHVPVLVACTLLASTLALAPASARYTVHCAPVDSGGAIVKCTYDCPCPGEFAGASGTDTFSGTNYHVYGAYTVGTQHDDFAGNDGSSASWDEVHVGDSIDHVWVYYDHGSYANTATQGSGTFYTVRVNENRVTLYEHDDGTNVVEQNVVP